MSIRLIMKTLKYKFINSELKDTPYLSFIEPFTDSSCIKIFIESHLELGRQNFDGMFTFTCSLKNKDIGIIYCDFKVFGGSFGIQNSKRLVKFINYLKENNVPLIFFINTIGVRIFEGRSVFSEAFKIIPALKNYMSENLLITINLEKALGLGALILAMGNYILSTSSKNSTNLTGPEVFRMFFGSKVDFSEHCSSEKWQNQCHLIHQIYQERSEVLTHIRSILDFTRNDFKDSNQIISVKKSTSLNEKSKQVLDSSFLSYIELLDQLKCSVRIFIAKTLAGNIGVFLNPIGEANLIDVKTLKKYGIALQLFLKLKLPIISMVDTAGFDPRPEQVGAGQLSEIINLAQDLINYPYTKFGVVLNRCFGGSTVLTIPTFFGADKTLILKNARLGIMSSSIIEQLFGNSSRLLNIWKENSKSEDNFEYTDLQKNKLCEAPISIEELSGKIALKILKKSKYHDKEFDVIQEIENTFS